MNGNRFIHYTCYVLSWLLVKTFLVVAQSFNQPKFCPSATWNATATTFAGSSFVSVNSYGIFINLNNSVYMANYLDNRIYIWSAMNMLSKTINVTTSSDPYSIFVTNNSDIYIDNYNDGVDKWTLNSTAKISTLYVGGKCYDLFIDSNYSLYCSIYASHKVIKRSLNSSDTQTTTVAGTGCSGILQNMLYSPRGIFVDIIFSLYVADSGNNRIQRFRSGDLNGTTVAGKEALGTITLDNPTDVVLDADGYLFIVDNGNNRIVGSDLNGFRCIVGCSGSSSTADRLYYPQSMAFDSYSNIFVMDSNNKRIQTFMLATNSCSKFDRVLL